MLPLWDYTRIRRPCDKRSEVVHLLLPWLPPIRDLMDVRTYSQGRGMEDHFLDV